MIDGAGLQALLDSHEPGKSLPGPCYYDADVYEAEMEAIFAAQWIFAFNECEIPEIGDYQTLVIDKTSIVVIRNQDGEAVAFHNTCRHRGSRVCQTETGNTSRLVCPYHQWTYDLDGRLIFAGQMPGEMNPAEYGLKPVQLQNLHGMIYVCLADNPPDFEAYRRKVSPYIAPHAPTRMKVAFQQTIIEQANWKLVVENNRECYHCAANHPELLVSLVEAALPDDERDAAFGGLMRAKSALWDSCELPHAPVDGGLEFRCIRLPFHEGVTSMTMDGLPACKKLLGDLTERDLGSVRMFHVPNNWNHFLSDHVIHFRVLPRGPFETEVRTTWFVHEDAIEGWDYDVERVSAVWVATNNEDRILAEQNFLGIQSRAHRPGPYSPVAEFMVLNWVEWYLQQMRDAVPYAATRQAAE